ncbi:hypothetical protein Ple7327_3891 [Pleurocapsa sp. PCC 7327]|uniref:hypothetical protein n=1 Tax=Pleurocapsa sp. PCC 7327 TaxID=118163 RepID=UPI00029FDD62|nr:hypothetical protein [Pleurocapsa sp. PCC 7327]AFY79047.1 hypothetical protein Ple7327_3891 [Pleurocapsa sp. PCC 7327]
MKRPDFQQEPLEILKKIDDLIALGEQKLEEIDNEMSNIEKELKRKAKTKPKVEQPSR